MRKNIILMIEALSVLLGKEADGLEIRFLGNNEVQLCMPESVPINLQFDGTSQLLDAVREVTDMYMPDEERSFEEFLDDAPDDVIGSHILIKLRTLEDSLPECEICT